jgi:hypothetical protein
MKRLSSFMLLFAILTIFPVNGYPDRAPSKIADFRLGEMIGTYSHMCNMETALPMRDMRYVTEVEVKDVAGYKSGTIAFGNCAKPGQIVRIKMKYAYADKKFFNKLFELFEQRFGKPDEYRGDPFQAIVAWKWYFDDEQNNRITMILQHSVDVDYKLGNSIKLTNMTLLKKEETCHKNKHSEEDDRGQKKSAERRRRLKDKDYQKFIPE